MVHRPDPTRDPEPDSDVPGGESAPPTTRGREASRRRLEPLASPDEPVGAEESLSEARDVPRPIGPERLRRLREAIRNGTYPTDADVLGGLVRLFGRADRETEGDAEADDAS